MIATQDQKPRTTNPPPPALADVALLDIKDVTAAARMSASWVHDEVRAGRFPAPLRFGNRCTRWRASDVRAWLVLRTAGPAAAPELVQRATKASRAAVAARAGRRAALVSVPTTAGA